MPSKESLTEHYAKGTDWDHRSAERVAEIPIYRLQAEARLRFINCFASWSESPRLLDIGAGLGAFEKLMRQRWPNTQITVVEPDEEARKRLSAEGFHTTPDIKGIQTDLFDLIVLSHVLEHVSTPVEFLKGLLARMHANSLIFIEVPNEDFRFKTSTASHVLFFNPETLQHALTLAGLDVVEVKTCGPDWKEQKAANEREAFKNAIKRAIPFKTMLRRIRTYLGYKPSPPDASVNELTNYDDYGEDRIWIRCLAKPKSALMDTRVE